MDESCTFSSKTEVMVSSIVFKETFPPQLAARMMAVLFRICFNGLGATTNQVARGNQTLLPFLSTWMILDYQGFVYTQKHFRWNQLPGYGSSFQLGIVILQETHIAIWKKCIFNWGLFFHCQVSLPQCEQHFACFCWLGCFGFIDVPCKPWTLRLGFLTWRVRL